MATYNSNNYSYDFDTTVKTPEQNKKRPRRIYSTALINQLIKDRQMGYDIDYDPFYMRDLDLRAPGITFRMTEEEMEIYQKCYDDAVWYVENFCRFMTDKGLDVVELRDFQKNVISIVTEETYIPENDDFGPKNRNIVWMAARQSGKCCSPGMKINKLHENSCLSTDQNNQIPISDIYYIGTDKLSLTERIKKFLYKIYNKL